MPLLQANRHFKMLPTLAVIALTTLTVILHGSTTVYGCPEAGKAEVMFEWLAVEYDWPTEDMKRQYEEDGRYNLTHNFISGIKTYKKDVYLSVPRIKYSTGVPSTLNKVVTKGNKHVLQPYPTWDMQTLGDCAALQCAMSMEVDPLTGYMYVIDPGRSGIFGDNITQQPPPILCPPKLVVIDLNTDMVIRSHELPPDLVSKQTNFLNDIVLDRGSPSAPLARWVYITDAVDAKLIVFDLDTNETRTFYDSSMDADPGPESSITVKGLTLKLAVPIDGLAMSPDFQYVYYCALGSKDLYQVPTSVLRSPGSNFTSAVRYIGAKTSQTGGMVHASENLYYGALSKNAVYRWDVAKDMEMQKATHGTVVLKTEEELVRDDERLQWPDSFTVDEDGYLWFTACKVHLFLGDRMDFSGKSGANYRVWRVCINEDSYLSRSGVVSPAIYLINMALLVARALNCLR